MTDPSFDQDAADELVQELGEAMIDSPDYQARDWLAASLVINLDDGAQQFGYLYLAGDAWEACTPGFATLRIAPRLRDAMRVEGQAPWKQCLIQIDRETAEIDIDFDYDGGRWVPDIADPAGFARSLKPGG